MQLTNFEGYISYEGSSKTYPQSNKSNNVEHVNVKYLRQPLQLVGGENHRGIPKQARFTRQHGTEKLLRHLMYSRYRMHERCGCDK